MHLTVIIPAYKVKEHIIEVVQSIDYSIQSIFVIDDCCPENSGQLVKDKIKDKRVKVLFHEKNQGVGGAMISGYKEAKKINSDIIIKIDGDGQMDSSLIPQLIAPILSNKADFTKGNRFHSPKYIKAMPYLRLFGNSSLSFLNKLITGYWSIMDPTNGFVAISKKALNLLELDKLDNRYFFESDLLFRLAIQRAIVQDVPLPAMYGNEKSNLKIGKIIFTFIPKYFVRFNKRILYLYFLRDFNAGTIQLFFGILIFFFGIIFGGYHWMQSIKFNVPATAGTIMLSALPIILGFQLLLGFLSYDINNQPK